MKISDIECISQNAGGKESISYQEAKDKLRKEYLAKIDTLNGAFARERNDMKAKLGQMKTKLDADIASEKKAYSERLQALSKEYSMN